MGGGETAPEGSAGAKDENSRGTETSARITISTTMTSPSAGTGSSTIYLHSTSSRNLITSSSKSSILGIVRVAARAACRSITAPVTVGAGAACHINSSTVPVGEDAIGIIKEGVVVVGAGAGSSHGARWWRK